MPRRPRNGLPSSTVKPGAGVDGADRHGLADSPFEHPAIGTVLRLLVRQFLAEQELRPHQPDAVAGRNVDSLDVGGVGDVD
jgi:hypothetical protein